MGFHDRARMAHETSVDKIRGTSLDKTCDCICIIHRRRSSKPSVSCYFCIFLIAMSLPKTFLEGRFPFIVGFIRLIDFFRTLSRSLVKSRRLVIISQCRECH